jgi:heme/copper-type cytochrome/quinol oxidase subunit 3
MLALPPAPQPAPKRQLFVGTALASAAGTMLLGGMLAVWLQFRADAPYRESARRGLIKDWMPEKIVVPEVAANMMLIAFFVVCIMAQWAVWSAKRGDRTHTAMALGMSALIGLAALNSQVFIWTQMGVVAREGAFHSMFYALTGTFMVLLVAGLVYTAVAAFRYLGRGKSDVQIVSAHALYWYFLTAAFSALWFVVYVQK